MSRALQICLMLLTTALCAVCVVQWQREGRADARERALAIELTGLRETLGSQTEKLAAWEREITRLNAALAEEAAAQKNVPELETKLAEATRRLEAKTAMADELSTAGKTLGTQLQQAMDERDALAVQLNERTKAFNALAAKIRKAP